MTIPEKLKALRDSLNLSQDEFSEKLGISQGNLSGYESGKKVLGKRLQEAIITRCNINPTWWKTGEGDIIAKGSSKIPVRAWSDLTGPVLNYYSVGLLSDCDCFCDYPDPDFGPVKQGSYIALRSTTLLRAKKGTIMVFAHHEGAFIGKMVSQVKDQVHLEDDRGNPFVLEKSGKITAVYRVVGVVVRV